MKAQRPYLLRALYDWLVDSDATPFLLVQDGEDVVVPKEFVQDGQIVLNVGPMAVRNFHIGSKAVTFSGRFGGRPFDLYLPMASVCAIYGKEGGQGMVFDDSSLQDTSAPEKAARSLVAGVPDSPERTRAGDQAGASVTSAPAPAALADRSDSQVRSTSTDNSSPAKSSPAKSSPIKGVPAQDSPTKDGKTGKPSLKLVD